MPQRWSDDERPSWLAVLNVTTVALPAGDQAVIERPSPAATLTVITEPFQADGERPSPAATLTVTMESFPAAGQPDDELPTRAAELEVSLVPVVSVETFAADDQDVIELPTGLAKWEIVTEIIPPWED